MRGKSGFGFDIVFGLLGLFLTIIAYRNGTSLLTLVNAFYAGYFLSSAVSRKTRKVC